MRGAAGRVAVSDSRPGRRHPSAGTRATAFPLLGALARSPEQRVGLVPPPPFRPWRVPLLLCARSPAPGRAEGHLAPGAGGDRARGWARTPCVMSTLTPDGEARGRVPRWPSLAGGACQPRARGAGLSPGRRFTHFFCLWCVSSQLVSGSGPVLGRDPGETQTAWPRGGGRARPLEPSSELHLARHTAQHSAAPGRSPPPGHHTPRAGLPRLALRGPLPVVFLDAPGCRASPGGFQPGRLPGAFTLSLSCTPPPNPPGLLAQSPPGLAHTVTARSGCRQLWGPQPGHLPPVSIVTVTPIPRSVSCRSPAREGLGTRSLGFHSPALPWPLPPPWAEGAGGPTAAAGDEDSWPGVCRPPSAALRSSQGGLVALPHCRPPRPAAAPPWPCQPGLALPDPSRRPQDSLPRAPGRQAQGPHSGPMAADEGLRGGRDTPPSSFWAFLLRGDQRA